MKRYIYPKNSQTGVGDGIQIQPYDLEFASETAREGLAMLASMYGNEPVILSGLSSKPNSMSGLDDGIILFEGLPVPIKGVSGFPIFGYEYCVEIEDVNIDRAVYSGLNVRNQKPYWKRIGKIVSKPQGSDLMPFSKIKTVNGVLASMLLGELRLINETYQPTCSGKFAVVSENPLRITKYGNMIQVGGLIKTKSTWNEVLFNGSIIWSNLSRDHRPNSNIYIPLFSDTYADDRNIDPCCMLLLSTNGTLTVAQVTGDMPTNMALVNPITYIIG